MWFHLALVVGIALVSAPAFFLGQKGQRLYARAVIIALAVPLGIVGYGLNGYTGLAMVGVAAGIFLLASASM